MKEKAILAAVDIYERLLAENGGELSQPWAKVKAAMATDKATREYVAFLPNNLGRAIKRERKERLVHGRPPAHLSGSGAI